MEGLRKDAAESVARAYALLKLALAPLEGKDPILDTRLVRKAVRELVKAKDALGALKSEMAPFAQEPSNVVDLSSKRPEVGQ
jgi:hypothetical protein